ncbi:DUF6461 domain-containing protein [Streptomyces sp. NPDC005706]|uniref:DUF6461 domain-containing protein n=1 Tax=Streptomyces sp. NPDC005706 TaxID=3157169 RepID=UPI0033ED7F1F
MHDGITWIARSDISWLGYCITLARGVEPEELVSRLAGETAPTFLGQRTAAELERYLNQRGQEWGSGETIAVRYGDVADLAFAVADGQWPGEMELGVPDGLSHDGAHVFRLYYEKENPKLPPPAFSYFHDGSYLCGFDMFMHTWSSEITGSQPDLVREAVLSAGIPGEANRDMAHTRSLAIVEKQFQLTLPREEVLHGTLSAALIKGQTAA